MDITDNHRASLNEEFLGESKVWLEQDAIDFILGKNTPNIPCNANIFKVNPSMTSYPFHGGRKVKVKIYVEKCEA